MLYVAVVAWALQLVVVGSVMALEALGLRDASRALLAFCTDLYEPGAKFALRFFIPESWRTFGNVVAGIAAMLLSMAIYAVVFALAWTTVRGVIARRRGAKPAVAG